MTVEFFFINLVGIHISTCFNGITFKKNKMLLWLINKIDTIFNKYFLFLEMLFCHSLKRLQ